MSDVKKPLPWFGILLIAFGIFFILDEIYYINFDNFFDFWPLIFIFWGINKYRQFQGDIALPSILIFIGVYFLLDNFNLLPYVLEDNFWAIALILFGLYLVFQNRQVYNERSDSSDDDFLNITNVFGGTKQAFESNHFKGGQIVSAFGGPEIDLRGSKLDEGKTAIHVTVLFGGIDFFIPEDWNVVMNVIPLFGGVDDTRRPRSHGSDDSKTLVIKGVVLFGGIDIK